jgi:hypothetical protein
MDGESIAERNIKGLGAGLNDDVARNTATRQASASIVDDEGENDEVYVLLILEFDVIYRFHTGTLGSDGLERESVVVVAENAAARVGSLPFANT